MTPIERDLLARTIIGEAASEPPEGQRAVASVILNRLKSKGFGNSVTDVVLRPKAFETWNNPDKLMGYATDSPEYQKAQDAIDMALLGDDPTGGAVNFLNPDLQTRLGRPQPKWAPPGEGTRIGRHVFYGETQMASNDDPFTKAFGNVSASDATPRPEESDDPFTKAFGNVIGSPAPEAAAEGKYNAPVRTAKGSEGGGLGETLAAAAAGFNRGLPVVGPAVAAGTNALQAAAQSVFGGTKFSDEMSNVNKQAEDLASEHPVASAIGEVGGGLAGFGGMVSAAPKAFGIGSKLLPGMLRSASTNALLGGADAAARGEDVGQGALTSGAAGAVAPPLGAAASKIFKSYVAPEVARLADIAVNRFKIPLSADLLSTNPMVRFASSVVDRFPFSGGSAARGARQAAFNKAVARTLGEDADNLTPTVMDRARTRIGNDFEYAARNTPQVGADAQFGTDLTNIVNDIRNPVDRALAADERKVVEGHLRRVLDLFKLGGGSITGQQYQQLTRKGTALYKATNSSNPNIRYYANELKAALDGTLERHAPADAAEKLHRARQQWWAMKTVEDLAEKAPSGDISPALLLGAVRSNTGSMAYGGGGDLAELGRIGQLFLKEPPSSGTGERNAIMRMLTGAAGLFTGGGAAMGGAALPLVAGAAVAPAVVGRTVGAITRSPLVVNPLIRGGLRTGPGAVERVAPYVAQIGTNALRNKLPIPEITVHPLPERAR